MFVPFSLTVGAGITSGPDDLSDSRGPTALPMGTALQHALLGLSSRHETHLARLLATVYLRITSYLANILSFSLRQLSRACSGSIAFSDETKTPGPGEGKQEASALGNETRRLNASRRPHPISPSRERPGRNPQTSHPFCPLHSDIDSPSLFFFSLIRLLRWCSP